MSRMLESFLEASLKAVVAIALSQLGIGLVLARHGRERGRLVGGGDNTNSALPAPRRNHPWSLLINLRRSIGAELQDLLELARFAETIGAGLDVGQSISFAWGMATSRATGRTKSHCEETTRLLDRGVSFAGSVQRWGDQLGGEARLIAHLVIAIDDGGGTGSTAFGMVAKRLRDKAELSTEVATLTTQAKATAWALVLLGPLSATVLCVLIPRAGEFLVGSRVGIATLGTASVLNLAGFRWVSRLVEGVLR